MIPSKLSIYPSVIPKAPLRLAAVVLALILVFNTKGSEASFVLPKVFASGDGVFTTQTFEGRPVWVPSTTNN